jgi:hypothetical protein
MKSYTIQINESLLMQLKQGAARDGKTVNAAILDGIGAYLGAESNANADGISLESGPLFISGLN